MPRAARALLACLALLLPACVAASAPPAALPEHTPEPVFTPRPVAAPPEGVAAPRGPLSEAEVTTLLRQAVCWYDDPALGPRCVPPAADTVEALAAIAASGDERFVAPLIDMLALEVGWQRFVREALEVVTGTSRPDVASWYRWLWEDEVRLPAGYAEWKGRLLSVLDPRFVELLRPGAGDAIRAEEILWGEVRVDGLPPLIGPDTVHRLEQRFLAGGDLVYGVFVAGETLAFPERILGWHEVVRSAVGGRGVLLVACGTCGGAAAYDAVASDGNAYTLGTSGLVYRSRRLLYDQETLSLWDPVSGRALRGPLAAEGVRLRPLPVLRTSWEDWAARHPDTRVLALDTGHVRDYGEGAALAAERALEAPRFPLLEVDGRLPAKTLVVGLTIGGESRAYPLTAVEAARIVHDTIAGVEVVLISLGPGRGVSVYDESGVTFVDVVGPLDALETVDADEVRWFMDQAKLVNTVNSRVREAIPSRIAYWFAWADAFPGTTIWGR